MVSHAHSTTPDQLRRLDTGNGKAGESAYEESRVDFHAVMEQKIRVQQLKQFASTTPNLDQLRPVLLNIVGEAKGQWPPLAL